MVSVCIASYNGEKFIEEQIKSILIQLKEEDELVISDDGSSDNTILLLKSFNDKRIKIYINEAPHGVNSNFENALRHTQGDYIFLADQDDIWIKGKVEACLEALKEVDCVTHDAIVVDEYMQTIAESFFKIRNSGHGFWKNIYKNTYVGCCMAFKRDMMDVILPIPKTSAYYHDNWIGLLSDLKFKSCFITFKGVLFRRHVNNASPTGENSNKSRFNQLKNRLILIKDLGKRLYKIRGKK